MLELRSDGEGVTFAVKVKPKSKLNQVLGVRAGALLVAVTAAPEQGQANQALREVLAKFLGVARGQIQIMIGETRSEKALRVTGLSNTELQSILQTRLETKI